MSALVISLASVAAYFMVGWVLARWDIPHLWNRAQKRWGTESNIRSDVILGSMMTFLFWPLRLPHLAILRAVSRHDPYRIEDEMRAQQKRIDELERELRIGRRS